MSQQLLPLSNQPNQFITAALSVDGQPLTLNLFLHYNEVANYWAMTVSDVNNNLLVDSIPFVTGDDPACNILRQFAYLEIGSCFILNQTGSANPDFPNNTDLGTGFVAIWGDTPN